MPRELLAFVAALGPSFLLIFVLVSPLPAEARCAPGRLEVWPAPGANLPANGQIALDGHGRDQAFVRDIATRNPRLVDGRRSVSLRVLEVRAGAQGVVQTLLEPVEPLTPGRRYHLEARGRRRVHVETANGPRAAAWTVALEDATAPVWEATPLVAPSTRTSYGCGPAVFGRVLVQARDDGAVRVRVRMGPAEGGPLSVFDVTPLGTELAIGHGMCTGPFELLPGARYRVLLEAVDAAGNVTPSPAGMIEILGP